MRDQYAAMITELHLFKGYTIDGAQRLIDSGEIKQCAAGEVLFKEGDKPTIVLLVLIGRLQVFVERHGRELILNDEGPSSVLGELAVLCGIPRSASVRVLEDSTILQWEAEAFRSLMLRDVFLSERIFRESLRTLIEKEKSLIESLTESRAAGNEA